MGKKTCLTYVELPKKYLAAYLKVLVNTFCVCYMDFMLTDLTAFMPNELGYLGPSPIIISNRLEKRIFPAAWHLYFNLYKLRFDSRLSGNSGV